MMKAAIYVRTSTADQTTLNQEINLTEYCQRSGYEVFKVYRDEGVSGAKTSRPQLDQMLQDMRQKLFDTIICWKLDRLGRSTQHLLQVLNEMQNMNTRLGCTDLNFDTGTPQGKFFYTVIGAIAELEREMIRDRIYLGLSRARKEGKHLGRPAGKKDGKPRKRSGYWRRWAVANKKPSPLELKPFSYYANGGK